MIRSILRESGRYSWPLAHVGHSRRVGSQVDEKGTVRNGTALFKVLLEESGSLHVDTHGSEDDGEVVLVAIVNTLGRSWSLDQTGLSTNLGGDLVVGQTGGTEDGDLLTSSNGVLVKSVRTNTKV